MDTENLVRWHKAVAEKDTGLLRSLLDEKIEFHSPTLWKPKVGNDMAFLILTTVLEVFQDFRYHREWVEGNDMALEFSASVRDMQVKGIDLMTWNGEGRIVRFEVLVRPLNGLQALFEEMNARIANAVRAREGLTDPRPT